MPWLNTFSGTVAQATLVKVTRARIRLNFRMPSLGVNDILHSLGHAPSDFQNGPNLVTLGSAQSYPESIPSTRNLDLPSSVDRDM